MKEQEESLVSQGKARLAMVISLGLVALLSLFLISIAYGPVPMAISDVWNSVLNIIKNGPQTSSERIIYHLRMPRVLGAFVVGMGLAVAGAVFQAVIRNPLVDPYITGVSSGAGFGAVIALTTVTIVSSTWSLFTIPIAAFIGGLLAFFLTFMIAEGSGGRAINYVLGGVIVGMGFGALTTIIMMLSEDKIHQILFFLFGSFTNMSWENIWIISFPIIILSIIICFYARELNVILLGEEQAQQLGINVRKFNIFMLVMASLLTALCVAFVGIIGFIGLIVPHTARMIVGGDHRLLLPASMIIGAILMSIADLIAKMAYVPIELPVGAIMTLIGVPFFAYLLIRRGKGYAS